MQSKLNPQTTARQIARLSDLRPALAIVLGSGFQQAAARMKVEREISYQKLAGFRPAGVSGHGGTLTLGRLGGTPVLVLNGRAHYYEGHELEQVTFPMRVLAALGVRDVLLTNAAGAINRNFKAGDFMLLTDHLNFMGANPLRGPAPAMGPRFVDMTRAYDPALGRQLRAAAKRCRLKLRSGVYLAVSGPSYETPAEIRAFERWGADAVGMSTVPEAIVARQCGLKVAGLSCITNLAAGRGGATLTHEEVLTTAARVKDLAARLLEYFAEIYAQGQ
jgi:purine-nucleoside phosphorylase